MKLVLIDGFSLMYRAYYATAYSGTIMKNSKGVHTNALYGFANMMTKFLSENNFTHMLVAFDAGKTTFRHETFEEYKGGRAPMPDELKEQIPLIKQYVDLLGIKRYELENFEADDIIGTLARDAEKNGFNEINVISGDKDLLQLIDDKTTIVITKKGISDTEDYTRDYIYEKMGITPEQVTDLKGLMGDKSDNLPGIPGVGEKTAIKLLTEYGTLENVIAHKDEIKGKLGERIREHYEQALMCKKMATIECNAPIEVTLDDIGYDSFDADKLVEFYQEVEFNSFAKRLSISSKQDEVIEFSYKLIDEASIFELDQYLINETAVHVCLYGSNYHKAEILGFGLANKLGNFFVPFELVGNSFALGDFLSDPKINKFTYDYKMGKVALKWQGYEFNGVTFDLLLAAYLINPLNTKEDMGAIALNFGYAGMKYDEEVFGKGAKKAIPFLESYAEHSAQKARMIFELKQEMINQLESNKQLDLFYNIELPLAGTLADMEYRGLKVSMTELERLREDLDSRIKELESNIHTLAGQEFNIKSPKQLGVVLFEDLGLKALKKTKTGYSTSVDVLNKLVGKHPIIEEIMQYRELTKLFSTYIEGLDSVIFEDGKVHTIFRQAATATGRLSSIEPNLQNIPIRSEEGRKLRRMFIPSNSSDFLLAADYSQIELRVLADISNTDALIQAFKDDLDVHTKTAMDVFGIKNPEDVTPNIRRKAKAVNFGIIYGISAWGLSEGIDMTRKEADTFIKNYLATYPGIKGYMDDTVKFAYENGYVETLMNRRRYIEELQSSNYMTRQFGERTAMNAPIQGSAADIIKKAMIDIDLAIKKKKLKSKLIVSVHDELIFDVPFGELDIMKQLVKEVMEGTLKLKVPLKVDMNFGKNWYEAK